MISGFLAPWGQDEEDGNTWRSPPRVPILSRSLSLLDSRGQSLFLAHDVTAGIDGFREMRHRWFQGDAPPACYAQAKPGRQ